VNSAVATTVIVPIKQVSHCVELCRDDYKIRRVPEKTRKRKDTLTQNKYSKLRPGLAGIQHGTLRVCKLSVVRVMYGLMLIRRKKKRIRSRPRNNAIFPTAMIRRQMVTVTSHSGSATTEPRRPQFQTEWSRLQGNTVDLSSRTI